MNLLFLRGQVPCDRPPSQIMFEKDELDECDDCWTQLANHISRDGYGEVLYWIDPRKGRVGKREIKYRNNFIERWVSRFKHYKIEFEPDVIFARGGFPQYDSILSRYPKAFKIYYGAGKRFAPQSGSGKYKSGFSSHGYDLILVDTLKQLQKVKETFPKTRSELFIKPAADNVFKPQETAKEYDVIFSSNEHKAGIKGHDFILPIFPPNLKMVQTGIVSPKLKAKYPNIEFKGWIPRKELPALYSKSKVAIVCCTNVDSCPRVISEALACNCPLLILDTVNLWHDKYINEQTGRISSAANFITEIKNMVGSYTEFSPYNYYREHLSLEKAAEHIKKIIGEMKCKLS